jgi:hypothetical protein
MSPKLTTGLLAVGIVVVLPIMASQPSRAESTAKNTHRTHHAVHDRKWSCERDPRCLESLSRAAAYGNLNSPHRTSAHRSDR